MTFTPKALFAPNEVGVLYVTSEPEALRLANALDDLPRDNSSLLLYSVAAELRRLHGEIESMRAERVSTEKELRRLHSVNQELVEALIAISKDLPYSSPVDAHIIARAALAKATGGQA